jgi:hypothetical protein
MANSDDELLEQEGLSEEIAKRWDPERLLRMVARRAGQGQRLDEATRSKFEGRLGADLSKVRIYSGEFAEEITRAHSAEAVTVGSTGMILMRGLPGRSMAGAAGEALLAHELTHVAQSQGGMHRLAAQGSSAPLATEQHEAEAEENEAAASGAAKQASSPSDGKQEEAIKDKIRKRVMEMFAADERVLLVRSGPGHFRP